MEDEGAFELPFPIRPSQSGAGRRRGDIPAKWPRLLLRLRRGRDLTGPWNRDLFLQAGGPGVSRPSTPTVTWHSKPGCVSPPSPRRDLRTCGRTRSGEHVERRFVVLR